MFSTLYDMISYAMRYWFLLLTGIMLFAIIFVSRAEYRQRKSVLGEVSQYIGYLEIVSGVPEEKGVRIGIARDNTVGSGKSADIIIQDDSVDKAQALLYKKGNKVILSPLSKSNTKINGRRAVKAHRIFTGDILSFGNVDTRVFLRQGYGNNDD